jgi:hypothetical protein
MIDAKRMLELLRDLREDCKTQSLGVECAMVTAMMSTVRFVDLFENGPRQRWAGAFGTLRPDLRNLQHALEHEFMLDQEKSSEAPQPLQEPLSEQELQTIRTRYAGPGNAMDKAIEIEKLAPITIAYDVAKLLAEIERLKAAS